MLDTSVLIARESGRPIRTTDIPGDIAVTVITTAELHAGVPAAHDTEIRARRTGRHPGVTPRQVGDASTTGVIARGS